MKSDGAARIAATDATVGEHTMRPGVSLFVPRYFFDFSDNGTAVPDEQGTELADVASARREALETLGEISRDELPRNGDRELAVAVRDDTGKVLLTASLSLRIAS